MLWRRPLWPWVVVALAIVFFVPRPIAGVIIFGLTAVSTVLVVLQIVRAFQRATGREKRPATALSAGAAVPPRFVDEPVSVLYPDDGSPPIFDPTSEPTWTDEAAARGANVAADWDGPDATGIRYTASAWYPLNVMRVSGGRRSAPVPPPIVPPGARRPPGR